MVIVSPALKAFVRWHTEHLKMQNFQSYDTIVKQIPNFWAILRGYEQRMAKVGPGQQS